MLYRLSYSRSRVVGRFYRIAMMWRMSDDSGPAAAGESFRGRILASR